MPLIVHGHPFSSYTQKLLVALYNRTVEEALRPFRPVFPLGAPDRD